MLNPERADEVLAHLAQCEYASLPHVLLEVLWHTRLRIDAAHGLDVEDFNADDRYLELVHRPSEGTTLKNGKEGERLVAYVVPIAAALTGWLVLGAGLSVSMVLGFLVVVAGFGLIERQTLQYEVCRLRRWRARRREPTQARVDAWPCDD